MLENNPYETKRSAEVPYFMRNNNQPKEEKPEEVDLSLFELPEEEVKEEPKTKKVKSLLKKPLTKDISLFGGAMILSLVLLIVLLILVISFSSQKKSIQSEYDTYKSSAESKIERLTTQNDALKKENSELNNYITSLSQENETEEPKQENKEESKTEDKTQKPTTSSNIKTGTYKVNAAVRVRVAPGTGNEVAKVEDMPKTIQYIVYANSSVVPGSQVKIIEVKEESGSTWGKLADKCWICIKEGNNLYIE